MLSMIQAALAGLSCSQIEGYPPCLFSTMIPSGCAGERKVMPSSPTFRTRAITWLALSAGPCQSPRRSIGQVASVTGAGLADLRGIVRHKLALSSRRRRRTRVLWFMWTARGKQPVGQETRKLVLRETPRDAGGVQVMQA